MNQKPSSLHCNAIIMYSKWIDVYNLFYIALPLRRSVANAASPKIVSHLLKLPRDVQAHNAVFKNQKQTTVSLFLVDLWQQGTDAAGEVLQVSVILVEIIRLVHVPGHQGWRHILR